MDRMEGTWAGCFCICYCSCFDKGSLFEPDEEELLKMIKQGKGRTAGWDVDVVNDQNKEQKPKNK